MDRTSAILRHSRIRFLCSALFILLALCFPPPASAQTPDNWYVTLQFDHLSTDDQGGGAALEWHRRLTRDRHLLAGAFVFLLSESQWQYARLGYVAPLPGRLTATVGADLGAGSDDGRGFDYRVVRAGLRRSLAGTPYAVEGEVQHLEVDTAHGMMLKGAVLASFRHFAASLGYHTSVSGNLDSSFVSGRVDIPRGTRKILAGFAAGRSQPDVSQIVISPQSSDSLELFVGFTATPRITVVLNTVQFEEVTRYTALLSWKTTR